MAISPRIMIVDTLVLDCRTNKQTLGLTLVDRVTSADFHTQFPSEQRNVGEVLRYAWLYGITHINGGRGFTHKREHEVPNGTYHLGDSITEKAAYDFGYVEPHMDTVAVSIAEEFWKEDRACSDLTKALQKQELITPYQVAWYGDWKNGAKMIHIISKERAESYESFYCDMDTEPNNDSHPISLFVFLPKPCEILSVGVIGFFVPKKNMTYTFATSVCL